MSSTLPAAVWENPTCGVCGTETRCEDGAFLCESCGLVFDPEADLEATFADEDAEPCSNPCDNTWHNSRDLGPYECAPCHLPEGHTSMHHTPCRALRDATRETQR